MFTDHGNEVREDLIGGRWVVLAAGRSNRPGAFGSVVRTPDPASGDRVDEGCPFCAGQEHRTPPEVWSDRSGTDGTGWTARAFPNRFPAFGQPGTGAGAGGAGPAGAGAVPADGGHEVIAHGPTHRTALADLPDTVLLRSVAAWRQRLAAWRCAPLGSVVVTVNEGRAAGASLPHSHAQVFATALRPPVVRAETERLREERCAACAVIGSELADGSRVVSRTDGLVSFCPWAGHGPFELLLAPTAHAPVLTARDDGPLASLLGDAVRRLRTALGGDPPLNLVLHTAPPGVEDFHWHLHVLPRLTVLAGFELATGTQINILDPDDAAGRLRGGTDHQPSAPD